MPLTAHLVKQLLELRRRRHVELAVQREHDALGIGAARDPEPNRFGLMGLIHAGHEPIID
jgi:hypothetical protein